MGIGNHFRAASELDQKASRHILDFLFEQRVDQVTERYPCLGGAFGQIRRAKFGVGPEKLAANTPPDEFRAVIGAGGGEARAASALSRAISAISALRCLLRAPCSRDRTSEYPSHPPGRRRNPRRRPDCW